MDAEPPTGDVSDPDASARVARTALVAALATIHPSRRRPPTGFLVGDDPRVLGRDQAIEALAQLPKPALLQPTLRTDGIVRLGRPRTALAEAIQQHLAATMHAADDVATGGELPPHIHRLLVRWGSEEFLLGRNEYHAFTREYHFMHGGHAVDSPDAAARLLGADAILIFDPADRGA